MSESKHVYLYLRVSNKVQNSFERQQQNIENWLNSKSEIGEYEIKGTYLDHGRSAYKGEHLEHGLKDILDNIKDGTIKKGSLIIAESVDRFSRQGIKIGEDTINKILDGGVWVGCVRQNILANPSADDRASNLETKLSLIIALKLAHEESAQKSERIRKTFSIKKAQGLITSDCPRWLSVSDDRKSFVVNPIHANTLRKIFDMRLHGSGAHKTAIFLNEHIEEYPTFTNRKQWSKRIIEKYLSMPQTYGKFKDIESYYPAVITKETFLRVQDIKIKQGRTSYNSGKVTNLFRGLILCNSCGSTMYVQTQVRARAKIACKGRVYAKNGCTNTNKYYDDLENLIVRWLQTDINHFFSDSNQSMESEKLLLQDELKDLQTQQNNLTEAIASAKETSSVIALTNHLDTVTSSIESHKKKIEQYSVIGVINTEDMKNIDLTDDEQRQLYSVRISKLIKHIIPVYESEDSKVIKFISVQLYNNKVIRVDTNTESSLDETLSAEDKKYGRRRTIREFMQKQFEIRSNPDKYNVRPFSEFLAKRGITLKEEE